MNKKENIFTIGDKTNNGTISKFEIDSNGVRVFFEEKPINYHVNLNTLKHVEKLFTTEDGVDIYEGNKIYSIDRTNLKFKDIDRVIKSQYFKRSSVYKYFSKKEAAEEYILMNKPCLSLNDVAQFYSSAVNGKSANSKNIINFVKSKL